ncbi:MAG TPA: protein phosphatase 2C domain-containing protein [Acidimicrobiales bacterium]|nr:protein phosphatase 2C domain-containing protein [Acidimicrobiales bacterium]
MTVDDAPGASGAPGPDDPTLPEGTAVPVVPETGSPDHNEVDFGFAAAATDRGLRHHRNEDAFSLAVGSPGRAVIAVCDGVSSSANPHRASAAAAAAAIDALAPLLERPPASDQAVADALRSAVAAAGAAVGTVDPDEPGGYPAAPSTTIVVAVVDPGRVATGSIGDSRVYFLLPDEGTGSRLTVDDSLAELAIAKGVPAGEAYSSPQAHVITRWLGSNEGGGGDPAVNVVTPGRPGLLVVCTDGLWNSFEAAEQLAALARPAAGVPAEAARLLVRAALDAGGSDNVTVAVVAVGPDPDAAPGELPTGTTPAVDA